MKRPPVTVLAVVLALLCALTAFALEGRSAIKLSDEGFLWYGCVRAAMGEVPIRDFQAYEPGRYLWSAAFLRLLGSDGVVTVRASQAAFMGLGLLCGLLVLGRLTTHPLVLAASAVMLCAWMWPLFRAADTALPLMAVLVMTRLVEAPTRRRCADAAAFVGMAVFFGRNHGLYAVLAALPLVLRAGRRIGIWPALQGLAGGLFLGLAPLLAYAALSPGFLRAEVDLNLLYLRLGTTNLPRSFPFPTGLPLDGTSAVGCLILLLPVVYSVALWVGHTRSPSLLAAGVVGLGYLHYVVSRPDLAHLAPGGMPAWITLVGWAVIASTWRTRLGAWALLAAAVALSLPTVANEHRKAVTGTRENILVRGERLRVHPAHAESYRALKRAFRRRLETGETLLVAPMWPGVYPLLGVKSPVWTLMFWFVEETPDRERALIERLAAQGVRWALVCDVGFDLDEERRLRKSHPLLWQHLQADWDAEALAGLPEECRVYRRRGAFLDNPTLDE